MADNLEYRINIQYETIKALKDELLKANKELENARVNTVEWSNSLKKVGELKVQMSQVNATIRQSAVVTQQSTQASSNAAMALLNLNYVVRDSPYFFQNFALGVLAVGNNLNPLIDSFARLRMEAGEKSISTFALLKQALVGGAGISIAFSVVVTAIQAFVFASSRGQKSSEDLITSLKGLWSETYKSTKAWDEFVLSLEKLSKSDIEESLRVVTEEIGDITVSFMDMLLAGGKWSIVLESIVDNTVELIRKQGELRKALGGAKEGTVGGGMIEQQQAYVDSLKLLVEMAKTDQERLGWIRLYLEAQKELDRLWGKSKGKEIDYTKQIQSMLEGMVKPATDENVGKRIDDLVNQIKGKLEAAGIKFEGATKEYVMTLAIQSVMRMDNEFPIAGQQKQGKSKDEIWAGYMARAQEEITEAFKYIGQVADIAGNAISNAFLTGKNVIDAATQALKQFIVQLLIIQTLKGIIGAMFGFPFLAGFLSGIAPVTPITGGDGGLLKSVVTSPRGMNQQTIRVIGKMTTDKNNFIANIRNADKYYARNEEFVVIGR